MLMRLQHASLVIHAVLLFSLVGASCVCAETRSQYQDRGNRHEGIKGKPVSGSDVELISARVNYTDEVQQVPLRLKVKFYLVQPSEVYLTVRELDNTYYYWMDNVRPAKPWQSGFGNVFAWPTQDVIQTLEQLKMNPYGLGVVARLGDSEPRMKERVAPVIFYHARFPAVVKGYLFTLRTSDTPRPKGGASSGRWAPQTTPCSETTCPSAEEGRSIGGTPPNPQKHIQLRPISLRVLMIADVLLHHVRGDLISYGAGKIPILPELLFPSRVLQLWKFSQETTRGNTLQNPYDFGNRILGGKTQQDMDVVLRDLHCTDFEPKVLGDGAEEFSRTLADIRPYNPPAILRGPNQMICCVIDGMTRTFDSHVTLLAQDPPACGRPNFSSPPKGRGFQVRA